MTIKFDGINEIQATTLIIILINKLGGNVTITHKERQDTMRLDTQLIISNDSRSEDWIFTVQEKDIPS